MQPKPLYQSKTIWINIAVAALAGIEAATGVLQPVFGDHGFYVAVATALPIVNMVMRALTTQPIGKPETQEPPIQ